jgi:hypothetical protein
MGDKWQIFLLEDKEEKPTAVLLPSDAREGVLSPVTEVWLFVVFGLATIISSLQSAGVPMFQFLTNPFYTDISQQVVGLGSGGWQLQQALGAMGVVGVCGLSLMIIDGELLGFCC